MEDVPVQKRGFSVSRLSFSSLRLSGGRGTGLERAQPQLVASPTSSASSTPKSRPYSPILSSPPQTDRGPRTCALCALCVEQGTRAAHESICGIVVSAKTVAALQHCADPASAQHSAACKKIVSVLCAELPSVTNCQPQVSWANSPRLAAVALETSRFLGSLLCSVQSISFEKALLDGVPACSIPGTFLFNAFYAFSIDRARAVGKLQFHRKTGDISSAGIVLGQGDPVSCGVFLEEPERSVALWHALVKLRTISVSGCLPPVLTQETLAQQLSTGNLRSLLIRDCPFLTKLPPELALLRRLSKFQCKNCALQKFPRWTVSGMPELVQLDLSGNGMGTGWLPKEHVTRLRALEHFDVSENAFRRPDTGKQLHEAILARFGWLARDMPQLRVLNLQGAFAPALSQQKERHWKIEVAKTLRQERANQETQVNLIVIT